MRETSGRADPALVQSLVKKKLAVSVIQILVPRRGDRGHGIGPGGRGRRGIRPEIMSLLEAEGDPAPQTIAFEEGEVGRILSEEITPDGLGAAVAWGIDERLRGGRASGIVVTHGTDTLSYTASLVFWLFPRPPVPIVLAASLHAGRAGQAAMPFQRCARPSRSPRRATRASTSCSAAGCFHP